MATRTESLLTELEPRLRQALVAAYGLEVGTECTADAIAWGWEHRERLDPLIDASRIVPGSESVVFEVEGGVISVQFDLAPDQPRSGANRCQLDGRREGAELRLRDEWSCWNRALRPATRADGGPPMRWGCKPRFFFGGSWFGGKNFFAEVGMPPGSPGAIFTLQDGKRVLVRPSFDLVMYVGPIAETVDVFRADGTFTTERTGACL
jgi:hypothetical protein